MDDPVQTSAPGPHRADGVRTRKLNRTRIADAAIAFVDEQGIKSLTMRRLAQELGVEAMSLYHYVNGREDLLECIVDRLVEDVRVPPDSVLAPRDGWQGYIQQLASSIRNLARAHPALFPLVATRPPSAPWLRPPLRSLRMVEDFLTALAQRGVSEEHAVLAYKAFTSFLLGNLLLEVAAEGASTAPVDEPINEGGADGRTPDEEASLADFPTVERLRPLLRWHDADMEFEQGLEALLDRLDLVISQ